jgi:hypothetical protein
MTDEIWVIRSNGENDEPAGVFQACVIADEWGNVKRILGDTATARNMKQEREDGMLRWFFDVQTGWVGMFSEMNLEDSIPPEAEEPDPDA